MSRIVLFLSIAILIGFSSCTKKGPTKACFTFSKESPKVNDTLYLLNCSENYEKFFWINPNGFYPSGVTLDSTSRHQQIVVTSAGQYTVNLRVGDYSLYAGAISGYSEFTKTITVNP